MAIKGWGRGTGVRRGVLIVIVCRCLDIVVMWFVVPWLGILKVVLEAVV